MKIDHVFSSMRGTIQPITQGTDQNVQVAVQKHRSVPEDVFEGHPVAQAQLYSSLGALASETGGNVMEILHIIMKESIKEDNETKRMMLQRLDDLNRISKAYGQLLDSLADSSAKLASSENKDESDAKARVGYDLYHLSMVGPDGQPIKIETISKNFSQDGLSTELKLLENLKEELRYAKQKLTNEFQHLDQNVNQKMQGITRILRALGQMRTGTGVAEPGM